MILAGIAPDHFFKLFIVMIMKQMRKCLIGNR